jgi:hypothetical protein
MDCSISTIADKKPLESDNELIEFLFLLSQSKFM